MRKIVYYVAVTLDGYISKPNDDISGFVGEGNGVDKYLKDLNDYDTVIMGRKTYEFGYKYGMKPGDAPYKGMRHYVFSDSLKFESQNERLFVCERGIEKVKALKNENGTDIYLCGGGEFAGWLLDHKLIDLLKIKLNPLIAGAGTKIFGRSTTAVSTELIATNQYDNSLQIMTYRLKY